ncbi:MAG: ribose 5-phosphate isomerase B [Planctomycetales bacterium]|nr:ribose 5-phosphate isomerase B [Planctomycetales bacterium]
MKLAIGADHRGVEIKRRLTQWLQSLGHEVTDVGAHSTESVDYPDVARTAANMLAAGAVERIILLCGTGIGMAIAANKVRSVRAHSIRTPFEAEISRRHNDLNALCLSAELPETDLQQLISLFLETEFEGGRHARRVEKLDSCGG